MRLEDIKDYFLLRTIVNNPMEIVRFRKEKNKKKDLVVRFLNGRKLYLMGGSDNRHVFQRIYVRDEYRLNELSGKKLSCVVDLGANVGIFASRAAQLSQKVICYEPINDNFNQLLKNLKGLSNIDSAKMAVAGEKGTARIYSPKYDGWSGRHSIFYQNESNTQKKYEEVACTTLDHIFDEHRIERCDLLKIDVEGAEYEILGATSDDTFARIERVYGEYHHFLPNDPAMNIESASTFLRSKAFSVEIVPNKKGKNYGLFFATRNR